MTSRERVLCTLDHKEPDRLPVDFGSTPSSTFSAIAYNNFKRYLGETAGHTRVYDTIQQVVLPERWFIDRFGIDAVDIAQDWDTDDDAWRKAVLADGGEAEYPKAFDYRRQADGSYLAYLPDGKPAAKMPVGATFFDQILFPYLDGYPSDYSTLGRDMDSAMWSAFAHAPWNHASEEDFWPRMRERVLKMRAETDKALMLVCGCNLFEWGTFLRRMDNFLMDLIAEPEEVERLLDALLEHHLKTLESACKYVGDVVDIIRFGDDLGMDSGPFMSAQIYRALFKPRHKQLCDYVKKHSRMRTFLHSCGSLYKLMPDLIEAGYDILNPIQTSASQMEPERLKKEFGGDVVFWGGGVDTRYVLNHGTPQQVRDDVKRRLDILMPGGGFVFNAIHNVMPDCPPENIAAMFDALELFGKYS